MIKLTIHFSNDYYEDWFETELKPIEAWHLLEKYWPREYLTFSEFTKKWNNQVTK